MADVTILDLPLRTVLDETDFLHIIDNTTNIDERTTILILANWILENSNSAKFKVDLTNTRVGVNNANPLYLFDVLATSINEPILRVRHSNGAPAFTVYNDTGSDGFIDVGDSTGAGKTRIHSDGNSYFQGGNVGIGSDTTPTNKLQINTTVANDGISLIADNATQYPLVQTDANRPATGNVIGLSLYKWNGNNVAAIKAIAGTDTVNKDNGGIVLQTSGSGGSPIDRLSVDENGLVSLTRASTLGSELRFSNTSTVVASGNAIGNISFRAPNELSGGTGIGAEVRVVAEGDIGTEPLYALKIRTFNAGGSLQDRLVVSSAGVIDINNDLDVNGGSVKIDNAEFYRAENASAVTKSLLGITVSNNVSIGDISGGLNNVVIQSNGLDRITVDNTGDVQFNTYTDGGPIVADTSGNLTATGPSLSLIPSGAIVAWPTATLPAGWLECDGSSQLRTAFPELFAVIGTEYGFVSSLHFNLPDYRGRFLRGTDNGAGNDPDVATRTDRGDGTIQDNVGTKQGNQNLLHGHPYVLNGSTTLSPSFSGGFSTGINDPGTYSSYTGTVSSTPGQQIGGDGGNEARPININTNWIIKT